MPIYQNSTVTDAKIEVGNYAIYVAASAGTTAAGTWVNMGAGMVSSVNWQPEVFTSQAGNAVDPIQGIARETATIDMELIEYDGSAFSVLTGGGMAGTSGSVTVGGQTTALVARGMKLINARKLATGSTQTTTFVFDNCFLNSGWAMAPKSDNDSDPVNVYTFSVTAKQYATAGTIFTKTVG